MSAGAPDPGPGPGGFSPIDLQQLRAYCEKAMEACRDTPQQIAAVDGHNIVRWRDQVLVVPMALGELDLSREDHRTKPGIRTFPTLEQARESLEGVSR